MLFDEYLCNFGLIYNIFFGRMLLEADADINQATSNGSCLHEAALYGKTDVVKFLLDVSESVKVLFNDLILFSFSCASHFLI